MTNPHLTHLDLFQQAFAAKPTHFSQAPGRLEILGNHTDYNQGFVLSLAVDRHTQISLRKTQGSLCQLLSPQIETNIREFDLHSINSPLPNKDWLNYPRGIAHILQQNQHALTGFQALITSDIPLSAGMSSSAALEMALVSGLDALFELNLSNKAEIGQACENHYIGANTGLMDQLTSLNGKKDHLLLSEYRHLHLSHLPFPQQLAIVVVNTHVAHDLSQEYNQRRAECESALATLSQKHPDLHSLRDVDLPLLHQSRTSLSQEEYKRALHVVSENSRVHQAQSYLKTHDFTRFGHLLFESHQSSIQNFENSCPELNLLVDIANKSPRCLGARLSGGGFGGISIHLTRAADAAAYAKHVTHIYSQKSGKEATAFVCHSADGATVHPH
ncbi:galactokinase [Rubritalea tangerina]|uniref:Galactokinase n=1 Tax=Rubritalea tangerina TaxID=430798 RepID=A0ABW4ZEQ6_9BACT